MGVLINFQHDTAHEAIVASTRYDRCPQGLPIGNRSRRNRHILVMSPDPSVPVLLAMSYFGLGAP